MFTFPRSGFHANEQPVGQQGQRRIQDKEGGLLRIIYISKVLRLYIYAIYGLCTLCMVQNVCDQTAVYHWSMTE